MQKNKISVPSKLRPLYRDVSRFFVIYGGRGSGKSWGVADFLLLRGAEKSLRILCGREIQKSLRDSVHRLLTDRIQALKLGAFYEVLDNEIRGQNGTLFVFTGLASHTVESIKSFEGVDIFWGEEAQSFSQRSLDVLIPTIRKAGSMLVFTLNPYLPTDPVYANFIEQQRNDCVLIEINYTDNPFLTDELRAEALQLKTTDYEKYLNIWQGKVKLIADGAIYKKEFEQVQQDNRITSLPADPALHVHTVWDLGVGDSTSIWFVQVYGREVRLIDYYEASGEGLPHYARILQEKGYLYGKHYAPHDIAVRELGSGVSRLETARKLGINFLITPSLSVEDGIDAARQLLSSCWFDAAKTEHGVNCLRNYRREYNDKMGEFKATPVHDWASHGADAFRYLAINVKNMSHVPVQPKTTQRGRSGGWMS